MKSPESCQTFRALLFFTDDLDKLMNTGQGVASGIGVPVDRAVGRSVGGSGV
jgi:hypothetical protein